PPSHPPAAAVNRVPRRRSRLTLLQTFARIPTGSGTFGPVALMNGVTEIYICKPGQAIKEGKLERSTTVRTRSDALIDSVRRCKADPTIAQITYYAVADGGGFK